MGRLLFEGATKRGGHLFLAKTSSYNWCKYGPTCYWGRLLFKREGEATIAYNTVFRRDYYSRAASKQTGHLFEEIQYVLQQKLLHFSKCCGNYRRDSSPNFHTNNFHTNPTTIVVLK